MRDLHPPEGFTFRKIDDIYSALQMLGAEKIVSIWAGIKRQATYIVGEKALICKRGGNIPATWTEHPTAVKQAMIERLEALFPPLQACYHSWVADHLCRMKVENKRHNCESSRSSSTATPSMAASVISAPLSFSSTHPDTVKDDNSDNSEAFEKMASPDPEIIAVKRKALKDAHPLQMKPNPCLGTATLPPSSPTDEGNPSPQQSPSPSPYKIWKPVRREQPALPRQSPPRPPLQPTTRSTRKRKPSEKQDEHNKKMEEQAKRRKVQKEQKEQKDAKDTIKKAALRRLDNLLKETANEVGGDGGYEIDTSSPLTMIIDGKPQTVFMAKKKIM